MLMFVCTGAGEELGDPQEVCGDVVGGGGETRTGVTGPGQGWSADFCFYFSLENISITWRHHHSQ